MIINLKIEITEKQISGYLSDNPNKTIQDLLGEINNTVYMGGDCINAMMGRLFEISCDTYIEKREIWNQMGDLMRDADSETYAKIMANK